MKIFIGFFLLTIFRSVNSVLCYYSDKPFTARVNKSFVDSFESSIRENLRGKEEILCHLFVMVMYPDFDMTVGFTKDNAHIIEALDGDTTLYTNVDIIEGKNKQFTAMEHSCSTHDYCEIDFLFIHIRWIINDGYREQLVNSTVPFLNKKNSTLGMTKQSNIFS